MVQQIGTDGLNVHLPAGHLKHIVALDLNRLLFCCCFFHFYVVWLVTVNALMHTSINCMVVFSFWALNFNQHNTIIELT